MATTNLDVSLDPRDRAIVLLGALHFARGAAARALLRTHWQRRPDVLHGMQLGKIRSIARRRED